MHPPWEICSWGPSHSVLWTPASGDHDSLIVLCTSQFQGLGRCFSSSLAWSLPYPSHLINSHSSFLCSTIYEDTSKSLENEIKRMLLWHKKLRNPYIQEVLTKFIGNLYSEYSCAWTSKVFRSSTYHGLLIPLSRFWSTLIPSKALVVLVSISNTFSFIIYVFLLFFTGEYDS